MKRCLFIFTIALVCYGPLASDDSGNSRQEIKKATDLDWPSENPKGPPALEEYSQLSVDSLIPVILGDGGAEWRDHSILACAWFMWKTRAGEVARKQRVDLADRIFAKLKEAENKHDLSMLASYLGFLRAREHILELLKQINGLDCCYGPALVRGLGQCGKEEDVPFLIEMIGRETESGGMVHDALVLVTGFNPLPNDKWPYDRQKIKKVWTEWENARREEKR